MALKFKIYYRKPYIKYLVFLVIGLLAISISSVPKQALAVSGSDFQAGRIIDNGIFFDNTTMTSLDVQNLLNAKVPICDNNGTKIYSGTQTRAQYSLTKGYSTPFTCLKDFRQDTPDMPSQSGRCHTFYGSNRSAAQIIKDVGDACGINPEVLLVLIQKESGLVSDDWPWSIEYQQAAGFSCPDTAPCDPAYANFFYQVYYAASQFKYYQSSPSLFSYQSNRNNNIQFSPISSCGSSTVFVQNQATAGLYNYTPYQPNAAALNNLYGSGDACSAYGNRNFWRIFNDWFGSTYAKPYQWQLSSQGAYGDPGRTKPINTDDLAPNTTYYLTVNAINMGSHTWHNNDASPINLGTINPSNHASPLCDSSWVNCARPATLMESSVAPGDTGTFEFSIHTPNSYGSYKEYYNLLAEGSTWMNDIGMNWPFNVRPPTALAQSSSQQVYVDSLHTKTASTSYLAPNTTYYMGVSMLNTGNTTWSNSGSNPVRLGTSNPQDRISSFCDPSWLSNRPATLMESSVAPGDTGTFEFSIDTPNSYGSYKEYFRPVVEGSMWMNDTGMYWPLISTSPIALWQVTSQILYTDSSKTTVFNNSAVPNNTRYYVVISAKNTGNTTWSNSGSNPVRLGTSNPQDRISSFCDPSWLSCNRPATLMESSVAPGDTGTFEFWVNSPYSTDNVNLKEYFRPVVEGSMWMNDLGMYINEITYTGNTQWGYMGQQAFSDKSKTLQFDLNNAKTNTNYYLEIKMKNTSGTIWQKNSLNLGTSNPQDRISSFCDPSWLSCTRPTTLAQQTVIPGDIGTFDFTIKTPSNPMVTNEYYNPVIDGVTWLQDIGLFWHITTTN
jgi:hypothetical protein